MPKRGRKYAAAVDSYDKGQVHSLEEAVHILKGFPKRGYDESVELSFHLGIDGRQADQALRGTVMLPHGTGKDVTVAVGPSKEAFYGFFLQFGTIHISPRPFASQALEAGTKPAFRIMAAGYWELIRKAFKPPSAGRRRRR